MNNIHLLDDTTINKIAAGEVVERPASVVKELIENAIDAGATRIEVETLSGGTSFIRVTDDGCGMSPSDAKMAIRRHATSKIQSPDDLWQIGTMGFRGEALPTIASVSRFSLKTRRSSDELGTHISIIGGKAPKITETGCPVGTTVIVEDLFFNTPARKKFLKTTHTEGQKISEIVTKFALAYPQIAFKCTSNTKAIINTPGSGERRDTIRALYGETAAESLLELNYDDADLMEEISISGFVSKPSLLRSSRAWQTVFVNGRIISSQAISRAIDNAYRSLLPSSGYPLAVVDIRVPTRFVDVNVHPQKTQVKFSDESLIFRVIYRAVISAIYPAGQNLKEVAASVEHVERRYKSFGTASGSQQSLVNTAQQLTADEADLENFRAASTVSKNAGINFSQNDKENSFDSALLTPHSSLNSSALRSPLSSLPSGQVHLPPALKDALNIESQIALSLGGDSPLVENAAFPALDPKAPRVAEDDASRPFLANDGEKAAVPEVLGQVARCYIIARDATGLYIIDQHAAHERVLYDRLAASVESVPSQGLIVHQIIKFAPADAQIIADNQELFSDFGFSLEPSGEREYRLTAVPADIPVSRANDALRQILMALHDEANVTAAEIRHHIIATTACHSAVRQGDELTIAQMEIILGELAQTARPYTCPHGRPTILRFDRNALATMFKRT